MNKNVVVVGGGLAGLAAAIYLARAGRTVTIFEKRRHLGGRAVTHLRHGYRFNLGAHALYRNGAAARIFRELGIPIRGGTPSSGGFALVRDEALRLPSSFFSILATPLLSFRNKLRFAMLMLRIRRMDTRVFADLSIAEWLRMNVAEADLRRVLEMFVRLATYTDRPEQLSAAFALEQLKLVNRGAIYVDEGWQKLVDGLHSAAVSTGVNFVSSSRVVGVHHEDGRVTSIELGELELDDRLDTRNLAMPDLTPRTQGVRIPAENVVLAVDPPTACALVGDDAITSSWANSEPVLAACLDVGLSRLPRPKQTFAVALDRPLYFSVHSAWAQLTPKGGALLHVVRYLRDGEQPNEYELESLIDAMQPGWRAFVIHKRWLPSMIVSNALVRPSTSRPSAATPIRGLYLAGDWVGNEGMLADAALASARAAAQSIIAQ